MFLATWSIAGITAKFQKAKYYRKYCCLNVAERAVLRKYAPLYAILNLRLSSVSPSEWINLDINFLSYMHIVSSIQRTASFFLIRNTIDELATRFFSKINVGGRKHEQVTFSSLHVFFNSKLDPSSDIMRRYKDTKKHRI
jgi:hypothetical protein